MCINSKLLKKQVSERAKRERGSERERELPPGINYALEEIKKPPGIKPEGVHM